MKTTILAAALLVAVLAASRPAWAQWGGYEILTPGQLPTFVTPMYGFEPGLFPDMTLPSREAAAGFMQQNAITGNIILQLLQAKIAQDQLQAEQRAKLQQAMAVVRANMPVSDSEIEAYYGAHSNDFTSPERYRLAQILVGLTPEAPAKRVAAARATAEALRKLVLSGDDFATVAREYSDDDSASQGGELGYYAPNDIPDPIRAAIATVKPGHISRIVRTQRGFCIVKVEEHDLPRLEPLSAVKDQIREKIAEQKTRAYFEWAAKEAASGTANGANW
jgi:parvulin-like peptidyl-prolyl isomerase